MDMKANFSSAGITPTSFVSEVQEFRAFVVNPALSADDRRRAYGEIVKHATMLDPHDKGYEGAGVALKEALCTWYDSQAH